MKWPNWKFLQQHDENDVIQMWARTAEETGVRMIYGIASFLGVKIPEFTRWVLRCCEEAMQRFIRIAYRFARVIAVFAAWLILVGGPCIFTVNLFTLGWMALAIAGSMYGLRCEIKKHSAKVNY